MNIKLTSAAVLALVFPLMTAAATGNATQGKELPPTNPKGTPQLAPAVVKADPGIKVAHTRLTSMQVSAPNYTSGTIVTVKVNGTGNATQCPAAVLFQRDGSYEKASLRKFVTGAWPRVATFVLSEPGDYHLRISMTEGGVPQSDAEQEACLGSGPGGMSAVLGDGAKFQISDIPK